MRAGSWLRVDQWWISGFGDTVKHAFAIRSGDDIAAAG
jgi:hypothetical protein